MEENINQNNQISAQVNQQPETTIQKPAPVENIPARRGLWKPLLLAVIVAVIIGGAGYYFLNMNKSPLQSIDDLTVASVGIENSAFMPATMTIRKGTAVTWKNNDMIDHIIVADKNGLISPSLRKGDSYTVPFTEIGTFSYHCSVHPEMKGTINIVE